MGLKTTFRQMSQGIKIPYAAAHDESGRANRGFCDLRGRPGAVGEIPEATSSAALAALLTRLATSGAPWFSLGCDLGSHEEPQAAARDRHVAGGYVHLLGAAYASLDSTRYHALAKALEAALASKVANRSWQVAFLLQPVEVALDERPTACPSLNVSFFASAERVEAAQRSREALLRAFEAALEEIGSPSTHG